MNKSLKVFNNDVIPVYITDTGEKVVIGRELHERLRIGTEYKDWFPRMCEYGFVDEKDFSSFLSESTGGRKPINHVLSLDMAKHIAMIQRTQQGFAIRQKLIELEKKACVMLAIPQDYPSALRALADSYEKNIALESENAQQKQMLAEAQPKLSYYDAVLACKDAVSVSKIAKDYGKTAQWLNDFLHDASVQYKQGGVWLLYDEYAKQGYTKSKTYYHPGSEYCTLHTNWTQKGRLFIYDLLKQNGVLPLMDTEEAI